MRTRRDIEDAQDNCPQARFDVKRRKLALALAAATFLSSAEMMF